MPGPFARARLPAAYSPRGGPVRPADLVGRESYIRRATARLADGSHILIAVPRRIGTTSVMLENLRRLRRKVMHTPYVDSMVPTGLPAPGERRAYPTPRNISCLVRDC